MQSKLYHEMCSQNESIKSEDLMVDGMDQEIHSFSGDTFCGQKCTTKCTVR